MSKTIVYCADGTWNAAAHSSLLEKDGPRLSNVYRLFTEMRGTAVRQVDGGIGLWAEEKEYADTSGRLAQVALYSHGVGENAHNPEEHVIGGAFGGGLTTRIRLGYAFISRRFLEGDRIVITGFSRGAYAARALADMIATQGLLPPTQAEQHHPLSWAAGAWLKYRESFDSPDISQAVRESENLHRLALRAAGRVPSDNDLLGAPVAAIGVFDTVGSMGLPHIEDRVRVDDYGFVRRELLPGIEQAFHAVSLDEERANFVPTFWDQPSEAGHLKQVLFPGAHADVGGGYPDHSLADVAFEWMFRQLALSVSFNGQRPELTDFSPNSLGLAHRPWLNPFSGIGHKLRRLPDRTFERSDSLTTRMKAPTVPIEGGIDSHYCPSNLPQTLP